MRLFPELIDKKGGYYSVAYDRLGAIALEGVKELKAENDNQAAEIRELREEIQSLKESIH
jgi:hypothetical protein